MSSTLTCTFTIQSNRDLRYWWPLLFEAMRRIGFGYDNPFYLPERRGHFFISDHDDSDALFSGGTEFRQVWDAIYDQSYPVMLEFWNQKEDEYWIQAAVRRWDADLLHIEINFPAESLPDEAAIPRTGAIKERLLRWLEGVYEIYALCAPCAAKIAWERWGEIYPTGRIDEYPPPDSHLTTPLFSPAFPNSHIIGQAIRNHGMLYGLDPWPIPWKGNWAFISLLG